MWGVCLVSSVSYQGFRLGTRDRLMESETARTVHKCCSVPPFPFQMSIAAHFNA